MANHIFILATVMLLAGIFGGLVNFYLYGDKDPDSASLPRFLVVGVGASFLVPVVLDMVNSELVLESQGDPSQLLIFTGFCLVSALLSRFVIDNMSDRILNEANVRTAEAVIAVTNDDQINILSSLLAKRDGSKRAMTLVNNASYGALMRSLGVDAVVNPRAITVSRILQHIRRGRIRGPPF